ncbi:MAG: hypothetical protein WCO90_11180, partial [Planctomycetota bacterium]
LIRGKGDETLLPTTLPSGTSVYLAGQSLLQDRYGSVTVTGSFSQPPVKMTLGEFSNYAPVLTLNVQNLTPAPAHPCDLNGRVLTFKPVSGDGDVASYRILRTSMPGSGSYTLYLANVPTSRSAILPQKAGSVVINGREFCPEQSSDTCEAWDGFGVNPSTNKPFDAFLAGIPLQDSKPITSGTIQASFVGPTDIAALNRDANGDGLADGCDNDNDGVADSWWISGLVPDRPSPLGGVLKYDLAFLVLDLDGRVNLNAAGSLTPIVTGSPAFWPTTVASSTISDVPVGMGYGPADVAASRLMATGSNPAGVPGFPGRWQQICQTGSSATPNQTSQRRPTPLLGANVEGRYGPQGTDGTWSPGKARAMLDPLLQCSIGGTARSGSSSRLIGNSPSDLNVRMKMFLGPASTGVRPLYFYTPDSSMSDFEGSPYQLRLDTDAPRRLRIRQTSKKADSGGPPNATNRATDNVFAVAEMERVLRPFDSDAGSLPPRLATLLDDFAERSRMTVTTDSWDAPVLSGTAMVKVRDFMRLFQPPTEPSPLCGGNGADVYDIVSPDVSAGLRFDINRPLEHPLVPATHVPGLKQRYCRHLFSLLVALGLPPSKQTAQWVANVCDFRDADSTMTRFDYDPKVNKGDAWSTTDTVFGAERPEVVITETLAWNDVLSGSSGLAVVLYHPWEAKIVSTSGTTPTELLDPNLAVDASSKPNTLDLANKAASSNDSVWRLRVVSGSTTMSTTSLASVISGTDPRLQLDTNEYACIQSGSVGGSLPSIAVSTFLPPAAGTADAKVVLERLADPTKASNTDSAAAAYNPYVTVDEAPLNVALTQATATKKQRSQTDFWKQAWSDLAGVPAAYPVSARWFHWPNRPFISVAELALVPTGDANGMLASGTTDSLVCDATDPAKKLILDAVHVPSRFAGSGEQIGGTALLQNAAQYEQVCTTVLPRWREPGRINVNTITSNTGNSMPQLDSAAWKALIGSDTAVAAINNGMNPFAAGGTAAADSFGKLLSLNATGGPVYSDTPAAPRDDNRFFDYALPIRVANTATIRSNVFAVWLTLRVVDTSASGPSPVYRRMFAIVDRSIPVGFSKGETLNVRDTIRLQRFLD